MYGDDHKHEIVKIINSHVDSDFWKGNNNIMMMK